jgi:hypothetical protein
VLATPAENIGTDQIAAIEQDLHLCGDPPSARTAPARLALKREANGPHYTRLRVAMLPAGSRFLDQLTTNELVEALRFRDCPEVLDGRCSAC